MEEMELTAPKVDLKKAPNAQLNATPITPENSTTLTKEMLNRQKKYRIKVASTEREKHPVKVSINGYMYLFPRDKWVVVPEAVKATLDEAQIKDYSVELEGPERGKVTATDVNRFSYQAEEVKQEAPAAAPAKPAEPAKGK